MANNVEQLANLVIAAYLEKNSNKTVANGFKKNKAITGNKNIADYDKLIEIINFYNTKAPVKNRLVLPGAAKATGGGNLPTIAVENGNSTDESKEKIKKIIRAAEELRDLANSLEADVDKATIQNSEFTNNRNVFYYYTCTITNTILLA